MTKLLLYLFIGVSIAQSSYALEFKHFQLKNELKALNGVETPKNTRGPELKSAQASPSESAAVATSQADSLEKQQEQFLRDQVSQKLLGLSPTKSATVSEISPLMRKIAQALAGSYNQIGQQQAGPLALNHDMGGGVLNFSGFTWQKPFANFQLYVYRQLAPDLFSDRWIVNDTFLVGISASTFLSNLKDADLIDISDEAIGAFAGVNFTREYQYNHFAKTFLQGLQSDYSNLFLAFTKFDPAHVLSMPPYQVMKQKDKFTFNAGGMVNFPPTGGLSGRAGVLVSVAHERGLTIQSLGPEDDTDNGEFLRLGVDTKTETSVDAHLSMQVDFFNLLKLTLLSYDLEYSYGFKNATKLSFYAKDRPLIQNSDAHRREFEQLVKGRSDTVLEFRENIVTLEERINQNLNSKYSVLLFGSIKKRETEQIKIVKDGVEKVFFKHYAESVKYIQNLWSRIIGVVIYKLFDWNPAIKNAAETKKKLAIEFEYMEKLGQAKVDSAEKFSINLTQNFEAARTHRWWHSLFRRESRKHLAKMTNLDVKYQRMIEDRELRGPLKIASKVHVQAAGLKHFNFLDEKIAFGLFEKICEKTQSCEALLRRKYTDYASHYHRYGIVDLMKFKSFIGSYFKRIRHYSELHPLFGAENVFMNGSFEATTSQGVPFTTFFKEGQFQGLGVIDTFMREGVSGDSNEKIIRTPASISSN